ncbi:beta-ketoacyl synthase N-terminal-like domain-containing protein [Malonomonas rubra]|uniref:beta-ketoacyl synthase N-terminal-like domain-containing protein n=1 Tax=Malonomonas rubra TaxID=57040 RepID=UPI0026EBE2B8|nr:beta-ketoacyl synthase N-terminal-like domain-containing protein [Malonomonas rubra]
MMHGKSVAIVGVGGSFPKSPTLDHFWQNIVSGVDTAGSPPDGRWLLDLEQAYDPEVGVADKVYSKKACFLTDEGDTRSIPGIDIDADFLAGLDPMFRLLLRTGSQAFADAKTEQLDRNRTGIIIGNLALPSEKSSAMAREYLGRTFAEKLLGKAVCSTEGPIDPLNRYVAGLPAGMLAKALGLGGTCFTIDAACASSLYAIKLAVDELLAGRADAMLAGGLSRPDSLYTQMGFSQLRALSPTGICSPFDKNGNGLVVGEGCGIFVLKRTEDAVRSGDNIYAVIRGIGLSNDIGGSLLAPVSEGQVRAMRAAYKQAGWTPQDVDLIECHATGTPVGDAVEFSSLKSLWGGKGWQRQQCVLGSVKSNIGHLLTAAGSAALMKTLLAFKNQTLPPTANYSSPADGIDMGNSPFCVLNQAKSWQLRKPGRGRRAAISAFGFGGINAHLLVEEWLPQKSTKSSVTYLPINRKKSQPVAIVGMGTHFGPWDSLEKFQERVFGGDEKIEPTAPGNWWGSEQSYWFEDLAELKRSFKGHFVPEAAVKPGQFRIPPTELVEMLPRQLLMLNVADQALQDAGLRNEDQLFTGVFVGTGLDLNATNFTFRWSIQKLAKGWAEELGLHLSNDELDVWVAELRNAAGPALSANRVMGALGSIVASRIAKEFKVGGPSFTLSSEENSGLRALEVGIRALQEGSINRAIVGAVDMAGDLRSVLGQHASMPFSVKGKIKPFAQDADGTLIGEGAAAVVLKRLEDAKQDGDRIYAVIKGVGTSVGGSCDSAQPQPAVYSSALQQACSDAGTGPGKVSYLETSGSGIPYEDQLESHVLGEFFGRQEGSPCYVGSVKADIGHAGAAAGLAALAKTALCLNRQILPPLRNVDHLRYEWIRGKRKFMLPAGPQFWLHNRAEGRRQALVSSVGGDGSCSHAVLESYEDSDLATPVRPLGRLMEGLFALRGDSAAELIAHAAELKGFAGQGSTSDIDALASQWHNSGTLAAGKLYLTFVASTIAELVEQIDYAIQSLTDQPDKPLGINGQQNLLASVRDRVFYSPLPLADAGKLAFVFPGSGNHFPGMGRELSAQWPQVFAGQNRESEYLADQYQPQHFWGSQLSEPIYEDHNALVISHVALCTAISDLVRSFGIEPAAISGYSLGESSGLFSSRAWLERDGMLQRLEKSALFTEDLGGDCKAAAKIWNLPAGKKADWVLGIVDAPAEKVRQHLNGKDRAYLLIINTYKECVVGGDRLQVEQLVQELGCHMIQLRGVTTVHCGVVKPVAEAYRNLHLFDTRIPEGIDFYSCARGKTYQPSRDNCADIILEQALDTIDYPQVIEQAYVDGVRIFIEVGPGNSCSRMISSILGDRPHLARPTCVANQNQTSMILRLLAQCLAEGVAVDLGALYPVVLKEPAAPQKLIHTLIGGKPFEPPRPEVKKVAAPVQETSFEVPAVAKQTTTLNEPVAKRSSAGVQNPLLQQLTEAAAASAMTHEAYLQFAKTMEQTLAENISLQMSLLQQMAANGEPIPQVEPLRVAQPVIVPAAVPAPVKPAQQVAFGRDMCMEFAVGSVAKMLGPEFAEVDRYPTRVRLPDEPLMLVDRILTVEGEPRSMTSGRVVTEHDVTADRWYLDGGRIPTCVAVEAGQADLFLSGYLGIDFIHKGKAVYRLLDAVVTFHRGLPVVGDTIHYDIKIDHFFRQDQTYLFRFNFEATVNGEPLLSMQNGCAGFFTEEELAAGQGIVHTKLDLLSQPGKLPNDWRDLVPMQVESYNEAQVDALYSGDLEACFGEQFAHLQLQKPYTMPGGHLKLVDRVVKLDPQGGRYGLGQITAEMDIDPKNWFLTCHFVDDRVMPGTLMYECCMHTLRIFLLRMGWVGEEGQTWCEPVPGVNSGLKCRGQVIETTRTVTYQVSIKELGYGPEPFAIVDALMFADGKPIVEIPNMSVRLSGLDRQQVEALWQGLSVTPSLAKPKQVLYDTDRITAFAIGNPSEAFGEPYKVFDNERKIARLPGPPFQFLDRIVAINGEPWNLVEGVTIEAEYDVPPDAWYFAAGRQAEMPFSVLLETGLQPCGWLAAYLGSALTSETDLSFRNLDGNAVQHRAVTPESGILTTNVKITRVASSGGMIIQSYDFEICDKLGPVYTGDTVFGFFSAESLAQQVGVRGAQPYQPTAVEKARGEQFAYPADAPFPEKKLRMIDRIDLFVADGGPNQLGYISGLKQVDPAEWFFKAHFYQDPVCPGSLGLESFLQLLKVAAAKRWGVTADSRFETIALHEKHSWNYRGQIIPSNDQVKVEAVITLVDEQQKLLKANGFLSVDNKVIYQLHDFSLRLHP